MRFIAIAVTMIATPVFAQTQADLNRQTNVAYAHADAVMTAQWKRTFAFMKRRDARDTSRGGGFGYAGALLLSQRAWLKFRDTECVIEGGQFAGGSAEGMAQGQCKDRLTRERTQQLKRMIWQ